jgi:hypothetical protein
VDLPRVTFHHNDFRAVHDDAHRHGDHDMAHGDQPILTKPDGLIYDDATHQRGTDHRYFHGECDIPDEHWHKHRYGHCHVDARPDDDQPVTVEQLLDLHDTDGPAFRRAYHALSKNDQQAYWRVRSALGHYYDLATPDERAIFDRRIGNA